MNCSLCKYRVQIVGFEEQVGAPQQPHHLQVRGLAAAVRTSRRAASNDAAQAIEPHPIEAESFRIIEAGRDWSGMHEGQTARGTATCAYERRLQCCR